MGKRITTEDFIERARKVHGDKYDYSKICYKTTHTNVSIICPIHGVFEQTASSHLQGHGCPKCAIEINSSKQRLGLNAFLKKSVEVHGNKYDYSKVNYINNSTKVCINCPIHGEFWQVPASHLSGVGCPLCNESKLEKKVALKLQENNIEFVRGYKTKWLDKQHLDFYLPQYNIAIECQGEQHFKHKKCWDKVKRNSLQHRIELDKRKLELCNKHNVKVLYYSDKKYLDNIITDENNLLEIIKKNDL